MSEEEKEAIELLKKDSTDYYYRSIDVRNAVRVALNYIDKLQKENEELKEENTSLKKEIKLMKSVNINENFISKDKIRNEIKELEELPKKELGEYIGANERIAVLKKLLGDDEND